MEEVLAPSTGSGHRLVGGSLDGQGGGFLYQAAQGAQIVRKVANSHFPSTGSGHRLAVLVLWSQVRAIRALGVFQAGLLAYPLSSASVVDFGELSRAVVAVGRHLVAMDAKRTPLLVVPPTELGSQVFVVPIGADVHHAQGSCFPDGVQATLVGTTRACPEPARPERSRRVEGSS